MQMRLIDANALKSEIWDKMWVSDISIAQLTVEHIYDLIDEQPTINPDDLRTHGWWITHGDGTTECSECHTLGSPQWKCCPVCTAKMDGKEQDNEV